MAETKTFEEHAADFEVAAQKVRRERIATAVLSGLLANSERSGFVELYATDALLYADALIAALDRE